MVQLLLIHPTITLLTIKAITADAASVTATPTRKLKNSTVMMFLSMSKRPGPRCEGIDVVCVKDVPRPPCAARAALIAQQL